MNLSFLVSLCISPIFWRSYELAPERIRLIEHVRASLKHPRHPSIKSRSEERVMYVLGPGHHSPSGTMTRRSDASNEWVICLFDFTGKDCHINGTPSGRPKLWPNQHQNKLGAINPGESHGSRCTVHHWLHCVLGTDWLAQRAMRTPISLVRRLTM